MTGSLQIKNGKYYVVARIPDEFGQEKQKWISTGIAADKGNKKEAEQKMRRILVELEDRKVVYTPALPFVDWLWKWLELKKTEVRQSTYEGYELYIKCHIAPYFKPLNLSLEKVTPQHLQDYYTRRFKGAKGEKGLSASSLQKHHVIIHGALKEAMRKNLLPYNPADRVTLPKKTAFEGKAYDAKQANALLEKVNAEPLKSAVILGLFYGLRRSEACGLRWRDIDFVTGCLQIRNTVVKVSSLVECEQTKSRASKRTMYLIPETIAYLKRLKTQQSENKLLLGQDYVDSDHVCVWPDGKPVSPDYVSHAFNSFLKKNALPHIRFHELRHTAGSLLLAKGLSAKQIQCFLGHEKVATTLDIYAHLDLEGKKEAAQTMDGVLKMKVV